MIGTGLNDLSGTAGNVVQARAIHGDLHFGTATSAARAVPHQIPPTTARFVNRRAELARLDALVDPVPSGDGPTRPRANIAVISGPPGVGKSTLMLRWAARANRLFEDGELYADLHASTAEPLLVEQVLDLFLRSLGIPGADIPVAVEAQAALFRTTVADRSLLILLDDVDASQRVRPLLVGPGRSLLVVTSRRRLSGLTIREGADAMTLDTLSPDDAENLIRGVVGDDRVDAERDAVAELCRLCGYLPLALRLVAEHAALRPSLPLRQLAEELTEEDGRLDLLSAGDDESAAVRSVFSWSYRYLADPDAAVFRLLGLHPGTDISFSAAGALTDLPPRPLRRALAALCDEYLLRETTDNRYVLHDLIRAYAREKAEETDPAPIRQSALTRLITWYVLSAIAADRYVTPGRDPGPLTDRPAVTPYQPTSFSAALDWFEAERVNLLAVVRAAHACGDSEAAVAIALAAWGFFNTRKYWTDWLQCDEIALEAARRLEDPAAEAWVLTSLGTAYRNLRRTDEAIEAHTRAAALFRTANEVRGLGFALNNLANVQSDVGDHGPALENFAAALAAFRESPGDRRGEGVTLDSMAVAHNAMGHYEEAIDCATRAAAISDELDDQQGAGFALHSLGVAAFGLGRVDEAITTLHAAIELRRDIKDRHGQARSLAALGDGLAAVGRTEEATEAWREALGIFVDLNAPEAADVAARLGSTPGG